MTRACCVREVVLQHSRTDRWYAHSHMRLYFVGKDSSVPPSTTQGSGERKEAFLKWL